MLSGRTPPISPSSRILHPLRRRRGPRPGEDNFQLWTAPIPIRPYSLSQEEDAFQITGGASEANAKTHPSSFTIANAARNEKLFLRPQKPEPEEDIFHIDGDAEVAAFMGRTGLSFENTMNMFRKHGGIMAAFVAFERMVEGMRVDISAESEDTFSVADSGRGDEEYEDEQEEEEVAPPPPKRARTSAAKSNTKPVSRRGSNINSASASAPATPKSSKKMKVEKPASGGGLATPHLSALKGCGFVGARTFSSPRKKASPAKRASKSERRRG
uniref:Uncharacterized protein n=1 Tax=Mycena chlorophos TaxID=658473 RepID=A0ABQ0LRP0_MYCCL|nr:predicted protein [Mycena chlorophos]